MLRSPVESKAIKTIGYSDRTLEVEFNSNKIVSYYNVPQEMYTNLINSDSIGAYFNKNIKDKYLTS